jgi:hypothetical protein
MDRAGDLAQHARAEGAVAHAFDDVADGGAPAQIQGTKLFETNGFQGLALSTENLVATTRKQLSQFKI